MGEVERRRPDHRAGRHDLHQQPAGGRSHRHGQGLGRHHLAPRRACLPGRGVARRLADRQCGLHAQLALRLFARQRRRFGRQGQVRRDHAAEGSGEGARSAATLGGWNLAVSKYSKNPEVAIDLVKFLASPELQKIPDAEALEPADHPDALRRADIAKDSRSSRAGRKSS